LYEDASITDNITGMLQYGSQATCGLQMSLVWLVQVPSKKLHSGYASSYHAHEADCEILDVLKNFFLKKEEDS
jgi:hypothetical protein